MSARAEKNDFRDFSLDRVRGIAIILVVIVHSNSYSLSLISAAETSNFLNVITSQGMYGVQLFFFLSGYLIEMLYGPTKSFRAKKYLVRRLARLYPLWIVFLTFQYFLLKSFGLGGIPIAQASAGESSPLKNLIVIFILGLFFLFFISPALWNTIIPGAWSIQAEVMHYLLFVFLRKAKLIWLLIMLICFNFMNSQLERQLTLNSTHAIQEIWFRIDLSSTFSFFVGGMLVFKFRTRQIEWNLLNSLVVSVFAISVLIAPIPFGNSFPAVLTVFSGTLLSQLNFTFKINSLLAIVGRYSYFLYFAHFYLLIVFQKILSEIGYVQLNLPAKHLFTFLILLLFTLVGGTAIGSISFKFLEKPFIQWSHNN
jgi:peptidoglycan/LPS O-acetylase OafA/YrhL